MTDQPSAGLVTDLKQRGLLDSTIVLWCGEFGRLPIAQGRMAATTIAAPFPLDCRGGFKGGYVHGATDDFDKAVQDEVRVYDLHATLLHALGLDHQRLSFPHEGRPDTLTDTVVTNAEVKHALLA
jgi:hypothetical protein